MGEKEFWDLIAWANVQSGHYEEREEALEEALGRLPLAQMEEFYLRFDERVTAAWTEDMACVAYLVNCYGDRSGYQDLLDFICWLVDRGRVVYEAALSDPDTLAELDEELPWESEGYWRRAALAWEFKTGRDEAEFYLRVGERGASEGQEYPYGGASVEADDLRRRWPKLARRFIDERVYDD
jgi:Protein of unknown function (DUF4240)